LLFKIYPNYQSQLMGDVDEKSVVVIRASPIEPVEEKEDTPVFQKFYPIVGEYWGINAGEFRKRIVGKSEENIQNAIAFTKEVIKSGAAKNPSGLFLEALTKGLKTKEQVKKELFEEKKRKHEIKITKLNLLVEQLSTSEEAYVKAINDCIRNITQEDPTAAERAIARIKESQKLLGEKMSDKTIEDFRQNEILRGLVKREIMTEYAPKFKPIHDNFLPAIKTIKEQIIEVEPQFQF
jgi:hypothetical protein